MFDREAESLKSYEPIRMQAFILRLDEEDPICVQGVARASPNNKDKGTKIKNYITFPSTAIALHF